MRGGRRLDHTAWGRCADCPERERRGTTMATEQGKETRTGQWPTLNVERIYSTTIPADELARALADHFRAKEFEAQVFRTSGRSEEHTSELQSPCNLVCRLLLDKKKHSITWDNC